MKPVAITPRSFRPAFGLRNTHAQSFVSSSGLRRFIVGRRSRAMLEAQQEWVLDGGDGVRLMGHYSPQAAASKGLAVLFHGWEGSSCSNYVVSAGGCLYEQGFDVFRLNFRDHGGTHHLNRGIFHSCRLDEVVHAVAELQRLTGASGWSLIGYSLGGNFALRVALRGPAHGLSIGRVVAVCPVISPANVLGAMERGPRTYERYYIRKWALSLKRKQVFFPDDYEYGRWHRLGGLRERTAFMATRYYDFDSLENYFDGYSVAGGRLGALRVPTTILTSADDMVVPVSDFRDIPENGHIELLVANHGGHCGFLRNWKMESLADEVIVARVGGGAADEAPGVRSARA